MIRSSNTIAYDNQIEPTIVHSISFVYFICMFLLFRVGVLARLRVIDSLFFLWTHKFQLKLTITRPLGRACIHNGVRISHGKSLTMSHFCPPNIKIYSYMFQISRRISKSLQIIANYQWFVPRFIEKRA